jgi:hypothetical protein
MSIMATPKLASSLKTKNSYLFSPRPGVVKIVNVMRSLAESEMRRWPSSADAVVFIT